MRLWGTTLAIAMLALLALLGFQSVVASSEAHRLLRETQNMLGATWRLRAATIELRTYGLLAHEPGVEPLRPHSGHAALTAREAADELLALSKNYQGLAWWVRRLNVSLESQITSSLTPRADVAQKVAAWRRVDQDLDAVRSQVVEQLDERLAGYQKAAHHATLLVGGMGLVLSLSMMGAAALILQRLRMERRLRDILVGERRQLETDVARFRELAETDALTDLPNRRSVLEHLEGALYRARMRRGPVSVLMLDVDKFKHYNDSYGHAAGDEALRRLAGTLRGGVRATDLVGRYGGEEFVVVMENADARAALRLGQRLVKAVRAELSGLAGLTISAGVATRSRALDRPDQLLEAADRALYAAKRAGGDTAHGGPGPPSLDALPIPEGGAAQPTG